MTPRNWGLRECLVAACLGLVAAGGLVGLLVWDRSAFMLATAWGCTLWLAYRIPNRNLLAELEATQMRLSAYNASDSRADLAEAPLTPPGGTKVELYDQDTEPAQLDPIYPRLCISCGQPQHYGSCPPDALAARAAEAAAAVLPWPVGDELAHIRGYYGVPAEMDGPVIVDGRPGLIVGAQDAHLLVEFDEDETLPCHPTWRVEYRTPDPAGEPEHIGQACVWPDDQGRLCAAPAVGWVPWHDGDAAWLCGPHYTHVMELADDDASDGPRSLPTPRLSD